MPLRLFICRFIPMLITIAIVAISAEAQEGSSAESPPTSPTGRYSSEKDILTNPLRPADTSSPRATLRSFLKDITFLVGDWKGHGILSPADTGAYERALETMDFSTTPDSNSRMIMNERLAMLYEILGRIALPPENEIPGDDDVVDGTLNQWTIPGTQISIRRIEKGPRAGEFLFSAWTVQRLHRFYRMIKHLPYQPDAIPGVYAIALRSKDSITNLERAVRNRLKPVDTSSPRATLDGFLDSVNRAYALVMETNAALRAGAPGMTKEEARDIEVRAQNLMIRAQAALDLSNVPEAIRDDVGIESVLQLKEIIDRMTLPSIEAVPDAAMVKTERKRLGGTNLPIRWRYPNTTIEIVEIMEGEQQGQFLFSAKSVNRLEAHYEKVRDLPYSRDYTGLNLEYESPGISKGFYEYYISTPGYMIPQVTLLSRFVDSLPAGFYTIHAGQTLWQWVLLALSVLTLALAAFLVHYTFKRFTAKVKAPLNQWLRILAPIILAGIVSAVLDFIDYDLNITGDVFLAVITGGSAVVTALWAWVVFGLCRAVADTVVALPRIPEESVRASLLHLSSRVLGFVLFAWVFVEGLRTLGINVVPLVASLGVGGLAVALAARPTMENIISSFMIYMDKPFRVGQRVNVMGQDGTVESIGLRSTKIRLLTGPLTSIPNEKMVAVEVENIGRRPYIRRLFNVTITYDTPPEKINRAVDILKEILSVPEMENQQPHPNEAINQPDFPPRVYFNDLNADSLNILVIYWFHPPDYWDYLEHANWINIQIMERFNAEGIDFAFPTQTLHLAGDDKRSLTVGQRWVSEEETFSPSAVLAQAAALGAQAVQMPQVPASNAVRPQVNETDGSKPKVEGELTDAPLEDGIIHGNDGDAPEDGDVTR